MTPHLQDISWRPRWWSQASLMLKMLLVVALISPLLWGVLDSFQTRLVRDVFRTHYVQILRNQAGNDRLNLANYLEDWEKYRESLIQKTPFLDFVARMEAKGWNDTPEAVPVTHANTPPWLPYGKIIPHRVFPPIAMLLDGRHRVQGIFAREQETWAARIAATLPTTAGEWPWEPVQVGSFDGRPALSFSITLMNKEKQPRASLLIIQPIDNRFLTDLLEQHHAQGLFTLTDRTSQRVVASNRPALIPVGAPLSSLAENYLIDTGPFARETGAPSGMTLDFSALIPHAEIDRISRQIITSTRIEKVLSTLTLVLLFLLALFWISRKLARVSQEIRTLARQRTGIDIPLMAGGDELTELLDIFRTFSWELETSRHSLIAELSRRRQVEAELRVHRDHLELLVERRTHEIRMILSSVGEGIFGMDPEGNTTFINPTGAAMLGWTPEELIGFQQHALFHHAPGADTPSGPDACLTCAALLAGEARRVDDALFWRKDGNILPVDYASTPILEQEEKRGVVVVFRDISGKKKEREKELRSLASRTAINALLETSLAPLSLQAQAEAALEILFTVPWVIFQRKGAVFLSLENKGEWTLIGAKDLSDAALATCQTVRSGQCLCGRAASTNELVFASHVSMEHDIRYDGMLPHGHYCVPFCSQKRVLGILCLYLPDGHHRNSEEEAFLSTYANTLGVVLERRLVEEKLKRTEEKLRHMAYHDDLTGLPNRVLFLELLKINLARAKREDRPLALMFLDLDRFKEVNDTHGHDVGDLLLEEVARRLEECVREGDMMARLGGDEFTLILPNVDPGHDTDHIARRIIQTLGEPFLLNGHDCHIGASIGISVFPNDGHTLDALVNQADVAMYAAKKTGRNTYRYYAPTMGHEPLDKTPGIPPAYGAGARR